MTQFRPLDVRVVLDTQVLLRGAVAANNSLIAKIYEAWLDSRFELLLSEAILNEIERVLQRPEGPQEVTVHRDRGSRLRSARPSTRTASGSGNTHPPEPRSRR